MNTIALKRIFGFAGILLLTSAVLVYAGKPTGKSARKVQKGTTNDTYHPMNINNVYNYYGNNGDGSFNPFSSDAEGFDFNKVTGANIIFEDGIVWGGYENNGTDSTLKVGGSTYNHGLQAGKILTYGHDTTLPVADNPGALKYRLFRVRADINPHTPEADVMDLLNAESADIGRYESGATPDLIYQAYIKDWNEWPAADGAPYTDVNHNGVYDPLVDIPGVTGADQTMWYVANDVDAGRTVGLYGSQPIGFEFQRTIWAYKAGPGTEYLGYTIFISNKIINKSGHDIDSMFITQWSDPDLGGSKSFNDNYVGCDTSNSRDLGYVYQGVSPDAEFGYLPPVGGFVLLQGPAVAGSATDSVMRDFKFRTGLKKLRMSSFNFFINGNATYSDPPFTADGTRQWYNLMNGFVGNTKAAYVDPTTGLTSKFLLWGDPVSGTGWLDGQLAGPADRRMCQTAGPFTFAAGDTEEIIIANSAALCGDRVSGIDKLRFFTDQMKSLYNVAFNKPPIPPSPKVTVAILNNQAVLVWEDSLTNAKDEGYDQAGFKFEGYNVYQFPTNSPDLSIAKRLATFDEKNLITRIQDVVFDPTLCAALREPVEFGGDNGVQHYLNLTTDAFNTFGQGLVDGQTYYFAVTAYAYNPSPGLVGNHLESQVAVISVTPHGTNPGNRYGGVFGDTVTAVTHTATGGARTSDGSVYPLVIDQSKLTGDTYKVTFSTAASGTLVWHLTDATKGIQLEADSNQSGDANYRIIDGIMWKVQGPPPGMGNYSIPAGTREWSSVDGNSGLEGFGGAIGWGTSWFSGTTLTANQLHNTLIKFATVDVNGKVTDPTDTNISYAYRWVRHATDAATATAKGWSAFIPNPGPGYAYQDYTHVMPFGAFDLESGRRLMVGFFEDNTSGGSVDGLYWPPSTNSGVDNSTATGTGPREFFFIFNDQYSSTPDPALQKDFLNNTLPLMWWGSPTMRGSNLFHAGDQFEIFANHPNQAADVFTIAGPKNTYSVATAVSDINKINVFPNPYFGFNQAETDKYHRFVTFNHLPTKATIRVYNIAGVLVKTIVKNDPTQFAQWNLSNEYGIPAAAGMYVIFIDMPGIGASKELKLAIVPETQYLDRY